MHTDHFLDRCDIYVNRRNELAELMSYRGRPHVARLRMQQAHLVNELKKKLDDLERQIEEAPPEPPAVLLRAVYLVTPTYSATWIGEHYVSAEGREERVYRKFRVRNPDTAFTTEEIVHSPTSEDPGLEKHLKGAVIKAMWQEFSGRLPDDYPDNLHFRYLDEVPVDS